LAGVGKLRGVEGSHSHQGVLSGKIGRGHQCKEEGVQVQCSFVLLFDSYFEHQYTYYYQNLLINVM